MLKKMFWKIFKLDTSKHRQYTLLYDDLCMQSNAYAPLAEMVDAADLKSVFLWKCQFESGREYQIKRSFYYVNDECKADSATHMGCL